MAQILYLRKTCCGTGLRESKNLTFEVFIQLEVEPALRFGKKDEGVEEKGRNTGSRSSETFPYLSKERLPLRIGQAKPLIGGICRQESASKPNGDWTFTEIAMVATQIARGKTQRETEGVEINGGKRNHVQLQAKRAPIWFPSKPSANESHSGSRVALLSIKSPTVQATIEKIREVSDRFNFIEDIRHTGVVAAAQRTSAYRSDSASLAA
ncbi:hypothetical protein K438DRAFT_1786308 [Mycena galopus ATCC 62051]|nr:hypothetical protein K438DRAFT_1786308 [Mycena galopus ATCC 62051]